MMYIIEKIKPGIAWITKLSQNKAIRISLQVIILVLCLLYLANNLLTIKSSQVEINPNILVIVLSCGFSILSVIFGALGFYLTLHAFFILIKWHEAVNIHLQSNLAKYIPGYAWQLIGKAYLTRKTGTSIRLVGLVMTLELLQILITGIFIALIFLPVELLNRWQIGISLIHLLPAIRVISFALLLLFPFCITWIINKSRAFDQTNHSNPLVLLGALISMLVGWLFLGYSYWLLGRGLFTVIFEQFNFYIFTLAASYLIGLAIIIVPGSIGVRESVMVWLLGPVVGAPQAVIIAALSRVIITISELLSAFTFQLITRGWNNPKVLEVQSDPDQRDEL